jgi:hypothetical protein
MAFKIFYAWQSDRPSNLARGLIRRALDDAVSVLERDTSIEDVVREIQVDQDTQNVPGSPAIADTILEKIRNCDLFVPDLTFIPFEEGARKCPNPNVLLEYGYALHCRGDQRIIAVMNTAFGPPAQLPFDLQHKRWPIEFNALDPSKSDEAERARRTARENLTKNLVNAIRAGIQADQVDTPINDLLANPLESVSENDKNDIEAKSVGSTPASASQIHDYPSPVSAQSKYPWDDELVGLREVRGGSPEDKRVTLLTGPELEIVLKPESSIQNFTVVQNFDIAKHHLEPVAAKRSTGWDAVRNRHGACVFSAADEEPNIALTASMLLRSGEIYGIDRYHLQAHKNRQTDLNPFIPTAAIEEIIVDCVNNYVDVATKYLGLQPPFRLSVSLSGISDYQLAVDSRFFGGVDLVGHIFQDQIAETFSFPSKGIDTFELLRPLFDKIYDCAGVARPDIEPARTVR